MHEARQKDEHGVIIRVHNTGESRVFLSKSFDAPRRGTQPEVLKNLSRHRAFLHQ